MSLLIKNAFIIDGMGKSPQEGDVLIKAGKIAAVGKIADFRARKIIDGKGKYLTPGFIDIDSRADFNLSFLKNSEQEHYLGQGVTTVIVGHNGLSLAPINERVKKKLEEKRYEPISFHWQKAEDFFEIIKLRNFGVNVLSLAGGNLFYSERSDNQKMEFDKNIKEAVGAGMLGVSFRVEDFLNKEDKEESWRKIARDIFKTGGLLSLSVNECQQSLREKIFRLFSQEQYKISRRGGFLISGITGSDLDWLKRSRLHKQIVGTFNPFFRTRTVLNGERLLEAVGISKMFLLRRELAANYSVRLAGTNGTSEFLLPPKMFNQKKFTPLTKAAAAWIERGVSGKNMTVEVRKTKPDFNLLREENILLASRDGVDDPVFSLFLKEIFNGGGWQKEAGIKKISFDVAKVARMKTRGVIKFGLTADLVLIAKNGEVEKTFVGGELAYDKGKGVLNRGGKLLKTE